MADLKSLSDDDLMRMLGKSPAGARAPSVSTLSDDDLLAALGQEKPRVGVMEDVGKSAVSGLGKGVTDVIGSTGDLRDLVGLGLTSTVRGVGNLLGFDMPTAEEDAARIEAGRKAQSETTLGRIAQALETPTTADVRRAAEGAGVSFYEPQTTAGELVSTAAEFVPAVIASRGARLMPGAASVAPPSARELASEAIRFGVVPGLTSEAAGQITDGTSLEPWARVAGALAGGGVSALASRPSTAGRAAIEAAGNLDEPTLRAAQSLMDDANRIGAPITLAEAVQQVTNSGTRLGSVQRVVEQSRGGAGRMAEFYADRPSAVTQAGNRVIDQVAPIPAEPYAVASQVQEAADGALNEMRQGINRVAEVNGYDLLAGQRMPAGDYARIAQNPSYRAALREIRTNRELAPLIGNLPDDSLAVVNEVSKRLGTRIDQVRPSALNQGADPQMSMLRTQAKQATDAAASSTSDAYSTARQLVRQGRENFLDPMERGPIGKLAATDDFATQAKIILDPNPLPGSAREVANAIRTVAARNPGAARSLVSQRLRQAFNETTQGNMSGPNQWGGAKFNAAIRGNPQQAENLYAVLDALNGPGASDNFRRTLDVFEAMGRRQAPGSQTEFNKQLTDEMKRGGILGETTSLGSSPARLASRAREIYEGWRYGKNTEALAALLTRPDAARQLARLAKLEPGSARADAVAAALIAHSALQADRQAMKPTE